MIIFGSFFLRKYRYAIKACFILPPHLHVSALHYIWQNNETQKSHLFTQTTYTVLVLRSDHMHCYGSSKLESTGSHADGGKLLA